VFYGVGAAKHCSYSNNIVGCEGVPTLDSVLSADGKVSKLYRYDNSPTLDSFFKDSGDVNKVPSPTQANEYAVVYYDILDRARHKYGVYHHKSKTALAKVNAFIKEGIEATGWDIVIINSDHGWKECNNGVNVACNLHSGATLTEINTPLYIVGTVEETGLGAGLIKGPVAHSDIAPTILGWFSVALPCEWTSVIQSCPNTAWPGNERDVTTMSDRKDNLLDGFITVATIGLIAATPAMTAWVLSEQTYY